MFRSAVLYARRVRHAKLQPQYVAPAEVDEKWLMRQYNYKADSAVLERAFGQRTVGPGMIGDDAVEASNRVDKAEIMRRFQMKNNLENRSKAAIEYKMVAYRKKKEHEWKQDMPIEPHKALDFIPRPAQFEHESFHKKRDLHSQPYYKPLLRPWYLSEMIDDKELKDGGQDQLDYNSGECDSFFGKQYSVQQTARDVYYEQIGYVDDSDEEHYCVKLLGVIDRKNLPFYDINGANHVKAGSVLTITVQLYKR